MSRFSFPGAVRRARLCLPRRSLGPTRRSTALAILAAATVILSSVPSQASPDAWVPGFGLVGADGAVHAASTNLVENTVTVGGEINVIGDGTAGKVARWDGDSWESMGNPFNGAVRTIVEKDGFTYVGGDFSKAGFTNTPKVARWNGSQWQSIGTGIQGPAVGTRVNSIAFFQDHLYVAGNFTKAGGQNAADIAYWDGDEWHGIGDTDTDGEIHEIVVHGTRLCAAGAFEEIGGLETEGVACWTGTQWQALDGGLNGSALAAVVHNGDLFVGGSFSFAGGVSTGRLAKWNGIDWQSIGYPLTQQVVALGSRGGILVVGPNGGSTTDPAKPWMIEWNGIQWTNAPEQPDGPVLGFAPSPAGVLAVGSFPRASQTVLGGVGVWTGGIFVTYLEGNQLGLHGNAHAFAVWNGELYVAGNFKAAGDEPAGLIAKWNVDHWESVGNYTVNGSASIDALVAGVDGLYAAGRFGLIGGVEADNVARWDGVAWSPVGTGLDNRVSALLAFDDGKLYAGGTFLNAGDVPTPKLAVWDGLAWSALVPGGGVTGGDVSALAAFEGDIVIGGAFTSAAGPVPAHGVVRFDGDSFEMLGEGIEGTVRTLHVHDEVLYAGGVISASGSTVLSGLASWLGGAWEPVGTGVRLGNAAGSVLAMTSDGDALYVGGSFSRAGDVETRQIARLENGTWSALEPGFREPASNGGETVTALAMHDEWLWIGGNFVALADGRPAARVIAWAECEDGNPAACPTTTTTTEAPPTTTTLAGSSCGDVNDDGDVTATDALFTLRAAVGTRECELAVCDADGNGTLAASDALRVLRRAVGQPVELLCP
jgi:hypothetical protein